MSEYYKIKIKGHLDPGWSDWFAGLELTHLEGDVTLLSGPLPDQTALHGLLKRIRDLNLTLISVTSDDLSTRTSDKENMMTKTKTFIKKHSVVFYFALTFIFTWGCIALVVGPGGFPITPEKSEAAGPLLYMGMLVGPSLAGILMTGLVEGKAGFRTLLSKLGKWRVGTRWYAIALLTTPALILAILFVLSRTSSAFLPAITTAEDKTSLLVTGIVMGLVVGFFEELGWTGFAVPRMRQRYGFLATGIITGLLWGAWHYPPFSGSVSASGSVPPVVYLFILLFSFLPAYRVLMVWIYDRTGSLLVTILMHAPLSACQLILIPPDITGMQLVTYNLIFTAALWVIVGIIFVTKRREASN